MISIELAPSQLDEAIKLLADSDEAKVELATDTTNPLKHGHVHTSQIDADFEYRPNETNPATGTLVFTNEVKHGMYKLVSDDTIGQHLVNLIGTLPSYEEPTNTLLKEDLANASPNI